jgi:hypothetical protein
VKVPSKQNQALFSLLTNPVKWQWTLNKILIQTYSSKVVSLVWFMVFNATFNNISVISWRLVFLVEEIGVPGENLCPVASHWQIYHIMLNRVHLAMKVFKVTTIVVIGTDSHVVVNPTTIRSRPRQPLKGCNWPL